MTLGQPAIQKAHPAANKLFVPEPTARYNTGIQYSRLIHRHCTSLDLEATFKEIKISQNIEKELCTQCQAEFCRCPAFTPGMPCSSVSSTPTNISDEQIPNWCQTNRCKNYIYPCSHLQMKRPIAKLQQFAEHLNTTG